MPPFFCYGQLGNFMNINSYLSNNSRILDLQPISWDKPDILRPRWLVPTIELIKYSFVLHHQHDRHASQELTLVK